MKKEDFTFVRVENALKNGLTTIISIATVVGLLLLVILMIVRKDVTLIVPILVTEKKECDMRDLPEEHGGMWKLKRSAA